MVVIVVEVLVDKKKKTSTSKKVFKYLKLDQLINKPHTLYYAPTHDTTLVVD